MAQHRGTRGCCQGRFLSESKVSGSVSAQPGAVPGAAVPGTSPFPEG